MCGIAGYFGFATDGEALLKDMNKIQAHRGPDGVGIFTDGECGFAHQRLAIIDRAKGKQPLADESGNFTIIYNGEVYNYQELRDELVAKGRKFKTESDTEVIVQGYAEWGAEVFDRLNGMFAVAIWNKAKKHLVLARDHFGIKPLYFAKVGDGSKQQIIFASEIKTILSTKKVKAAPNDRLIYRYLRFRAHEDTPETFFEGIEKLMPGEMMVVDKSGIARSSYTNLREELAALATHNKAYMPSETDEYRKKLIDSIRMRLVSEVPVGTCLSGGLDSSTIALIVNKLLSEKDTAANSVGVSQNTFSAVFPGSINDEEKYIDAVLEKAKGHIASHKVYPTADSFAADLEDFVHTQEEPTISTGPYAQYKVMEEARNHVTVLLDGQGADEMLAGYYPYYFVYLRQLKRDGQWMKLVGEMLRSTDVLFRFLRFRIYDKLNFRKKVGIPELLNGDFKSKHNKEIFAPIQNDLKKRFVEDIFYNSLPALLRYEDKNTMRFSLEGRVPFLDKEVVQYLFSLSNDAIIRGSWNKRILRDATQGLLPESIRSRRNKIGFTTPEQEWFKRLKTRFYGVFLSESFANRPYFNQQAVLAAFEGHIKGRNTTDTMVFWRMLNVELWMREFIDEKPATTDKPKEKSDFEPNAEKKLDIKANGATYRRYPLRTKMVNADDELAPFVTERLAEFFAALEKNAAHKNYLGKPWRLFISEKIVAITQGRSYFIWDIKPSFWARTLSKFVVKTPYGIGLGSPWTMQLAIEEAGLLRILFASVAAAAGKALGKKGLFYELAGADVRAIDGPTEYSVYPSNVSAKLPPKDPSKVAVKLDEAIRKAMPDIATNFKGVVVIDANDLGRNVLGHNTDQPEAKLEAVFADNPLGQGSERTPLCVVVEEK